MNIEQTEKEQLIRIKNKEYFEEWFDIVKPYLLSDEFQIRKKFTHHHDSVYNHAVMVSYKSFVFGKKHNVDPKLCAIAGLLHDFFPYTWRKSFELDNISPEYNRRIREKSFKVKIHGFLHGKEASENIIKYFPELNNKIIQDAVSHHMFPLTLPPKTKVGWVITLMDKVDATVDVIGINKKERN